MPQEVEVMLKEVARNAEIWLEALDNVKNLPVFQTSHGQLYLISEKIKMEWILLTVQLIQEIFIPESLDADDGGFGGVGEEEEEDDPLSDYDSSIEDDM